jgi:hypothetical protein
VEASDIVQILPQRIFPSRSIRLPSRGEIVARYGKHYLRLGVQRRHDDSRQPPYQSGSYDRS